MQGLVLVLDEVVNILVILSQLLLKFVLQALDLVDLHLVCRDTLLDGVDRSSHLVGHCGVQHGCKVLLSDHVIVLLTLRDVNELHHFTLLIVLEEGGNVEAEIHFIMGFLARLDHVYLLREILLV